MVELCDHNIKKVHFRPFCQIQCFFLFFFVFFCRSQNTFYGFVDGIIANGGGDGPEDIMGGLQTAFSQLSWGDKDVCKVSEEKLA